MLAAAQPLRFYAVRVALRPYRYICKYEMHPILRMRSSAVKGSAYTSTATLFLKMRLEARNIALQFQKSEHHHLQPPFVAMLWD